MAQHFTSETASAAGHKSVAARAKNKAAQKLVADKAALLAEQVLEANAVIVANGTAKNLEARNGKAANSVVVASLESGSTRQHAAETLISAALAATLSRLALGTGLLTSRNCADVLKALASLKVAYAPAKQETATLSLSATVSAEEIESIRSRLTQRAGL